MKKLFLTVVALFAMTLAWAQELVPEDIRPIYRRSFTAKYDIIGEEPVREAALSPNGELVGFVRDNNLFIKNIATGDIEQITHDGERNRIINGATDWVYEEEYLFTRAWKFSPDSRRIAYLRFDESRVPEFTMMRYDGRLYPEPYTFKYPKAGEANSIVTLWVYDISSGRTRQVDTGRNADGGLNDASEQDQYIPRIDWTPSGGRNADGELFFYRVNRLQNHFEVVLVEEDSRANRSSGNRGSGGRNRGGFGEPRVIYSESSPRYVERPTDETVVFSPDGEHFTVENETRTGFGETQVYSIDRGFLEVAGNEFEEEPHSPEYWNRKVKDGRKFFSFTGDSGIELYGWMMTPEGFDPEGALKYPVLMTQYSGPGSESVFVEEIHPGDMMIYKPLLEAGYIVVCVDPRGTGGRGEEFKKCTYGRLGQLETEDQIAAARWLGGLDYVDPARIGIYGWSYGGFIALNSVLKGADVFSLAVAVAPVTSWRFYDSIYTEIYNGLPAENPAGYDDNSPINYAGLLRGKLLLVHGTGDDNVHIQNSYEMAGALVAADKQFDMMVYPDDNHSMMPAGALHVRRKIVDYVTGNL